MTRKTTAIIDLSALRHNLSVVRNHAPTSRILAVIKANGYGHGIEPIGLALKEADAFAVATMSEALRLREAGINKPVVLLQGVNNESDLAQVEKYHLDLVVHHQQQIDLLQSYAPSKLSFWLKVNTGMNRLGISTSMVDESIEQLSQLNPKEIILMTHFANADNREDSFTQKQIDRFEKLEQTKQLETSMANSAGILHWPSAHHDWVRAGIMLYGATPFNSGTAEELGLRPVMTLVSELIAVNRCEAGEPIGYGGLWRCPETMLVGVVAIGYGDGYPRHISENTPVLINGIRCPIIGRVSMDMLCVDLRSVPQAQITDEVLLWGKGLPIEEIALKAATLTYEIFCQVTGRVKFSYLD